ncbi:integrating conjugative element protein, partial [Ectothiorhodospira haloalkaliphila]|uniref:integrating conjugative element protein n=1 Tax=Ectothiorhodospira haloalkaliphila TaxID=421628 RepID=UPI001EE87611
MNSPAPALRYLGGWAVLACLSGLPIHSLSAAPEVIFDSGQTVPLAPYRAPLEAEEADSGPGLATPPVSPGQSPGGVVDLASRLPLTTPALRPGRVTEDARGDVRERLQYLPRPFCVLGTDRFSLQWLVTHRAVLRREQVACLVVEVPDEAAYQRLQEAAEGVPLTPVPGEDLAAQFGLSVYPLLITREGFE